jgi:hypothetical protein
VKGLHNGCVIVAGHGNDCLGKAMVAAVALIEVIEQPCAIEPQLRPLGSGVHPGAGYLAEVSDDRGHIAPIAMETNRSRFGDLPILYNWSLANDHQVVYRRSTVSAHWPCSLIDRDELAIYLDRRRCELLQQFGHASSS